VLFDNVLLNFIYRKVFFSIGNGDRGMRNSVEFFSGKIRHIMITPVVKEKIMEQRPARGRAVIQLQDFAYPVREISNILNVFID